MLEGLISEDGSRIIKKLLQSSQYEKAFLLHIMMYLPRYFKNKSISLTGDRRQFRFVQSLRA